MVFELENRTIVTHGPTLRGLSLSRTLRDKKPAIHLSFGTLCSCEGKSGSNRVNVVYRKAPSRQDIKRSSLSTFIGGFFQAMPHVIPAELSPLTAPKTVLH